MLRVKDVIRITGWSEYRVLKLIKIGKLPAVNVGTGKIPRWEIRQEDLDSFLTPKAVIEVEKRRKAQEPKRARLDAGVKDRASSLVKQVPNILTDR